MHLLYRICRAASAEALHEDFRSTSHFEGVSYEDAQLCALDHFAEYLDEGIGINERSEEGLSMLMTSFKGGHH